MKDNMFCYSTHNLRDVFAAAALTGLLSSETAEWNYTGIPEQAARIAYEYADLMLEQREK